MSPMRTDLRVNQDHIFISAINLGTINKFVREINELVDFRGYDKIFIDFERDLSYVFVDRLAQFSGIINHFKNRRNIEFVFSEGYNEQTYIQKSFFQEPRLISENASWVNSKPLQTVWAFEDSQDVHSYIDSVVNEVSSVTELSKGFLQSLEWSFFEVIDNVIQHSDAGYGLIMSDIVRNSRIDIAVFDDGKGIYNSLKHTPHRGRNATEAIYSSMQESVTRSRVHQGNGLWGLTELIKQNGGRLSIASHNAAVVIQDNKPPENHTISTIDLKKHACTRVMYDVQLDNILDIRQTMRSGKSVKNYEPVNLRLEKFEDNSSDVNVFKVLELASGFGTRKCGALVRNKVVNLINDSNKPVNIDFDGVNMISSSFADEFIAKIAAKYGIIHFAKMITLINLDDTISDLIDIAINKRLASGLDDSDK